MFKDEVRDDIPKPSSQWSESEKRKMSLNSKAMNALFCALDVRVHKKYGINLKLSIKGQIKLKSLKLVNTLVNTNCSKWNKIKMCILCILDLRTSKHPRSFGKNFPK